MNLYERTIELKCKSGTTIFNLDSERIIFTSAFLIIL